MVQGYEKLTGYCEHCSDICVVLNVRGGGFVRSRGDTELLKRTLLHGFG